MTPSEFLHHYAQQTNTHQFANLVPLIASDAIYWFNDGSFYGREQIQAAFEKTWGLIKNEHYAIENVQWLSLTDQQAVCLYHFHWQGEVDGKTVSGRGRGTNVLRNDGEQWQVVHEHLSRMPT